MTPSGAGERHDECRAQRGGPVHERQSASSMYQTMPSPRRLATWKIRRGSANAAPRFNLRHSPYSAASTRAMNVLNPLAFMCPGLRRGPLK